MTPETEAYLTELRAPTLLEPAEARNAIVLAFSELAHRIDMQSGVYLRLLRNASLTETEQGICAQLPGHVQKLNALRRELAEAERELGQAVHALAEFEGMGSTLIFTIENPDTPTPQERPLVSAEVSRIQRLAEAEVARMRVGPTVSDEEAAAIDAANAEARSLAVAPTNATEAQPEGA